jgi:dihydrofolate synthase / folylpolyglutamate synthase
MPHTLSDWLAHCERLHPVTIELGLDRVQRVRERMGLQFDVPVFTVAGTNGKGSTCAMLEAILLQGGYRTAVYGSPHLVHFEERLRLNGDVVQAEVLLPHFSVVEAARGGESLTYFEFTTLAILNIIDADCAIITSIDLDHMDYLGPDRESIGREKAGIMRAGRPVVVSDPVPPRSVIEHAEALGADLWLFGRDFNYSGDRQQWGWSGRGRRYNAMAYPALRGANQLLNASGVLAALDAMRPRLSVPAQAVRNGLALVELPGRFQVVPGQPTLVLDVAHNPHASAVLAQNLDQMGYFPRTHAVLGAMADKDIAGLVGPLLSLVDVWHLCDLPTPRAATAEGLRAAIAAARAARPSGSAPLPAPVLHCNSDPQAALGAALKGADPTDRIVVFGSFHTVGGVLQHGLPRLGAAHVG